MTNNPDAGPWKQTFTGKALYLLHPRHEDIDLVDIGWHLSQICRFTGATICHYSVAEHCVHLSNYVPAKYALDALLSDGAEAYIGDMARPEKSLFPGFKLLEDAIQLQICLKYGLHWPIPYEVKLIDDAILANERRDMMTKPPIPWQDTGGPIPGLTIQGWHQKAAYGMFMSRLTELTKDRRDDFKTTV